MPRRSPPSGPSIEVLRLGHRPGRDPRLTTHLALAARALGAERLWLHPPDPAIADRLEAVARRWGGRFSVEGCVDWRGMIRRFDGVVVHLTMYGRPLPALLPKLRRARRLLAVVGGAKVPADVYRLAHLNVAVGPQPHSEVAGLALLLYALHGLPGPERWAGAQQRIVPSARGKRVRRAR
jgi:tRNA (cytidine56-2'-O)-methyltransferase